MLGPVVTGKNYSIERLDSRGRLGSLARDSLGSLTRERERESELVA